MRRDVVFMGVLLWAAALGGCGSNAVPVTKDWGTADRGAIDQAQQGDGVKPTDQQLSDGPRADAPVKTDGPGKTDGPIVLPDAMRPDAVSTKDGPANCGTLGQHIKLGQVCCNGLTAGAVAIPPSCISIGQDFVCVKCGDGICDAKSGEDACSCSKDCSGTTVNDCAKAGGYCETQFTACKVGYQDDASLYCGAKALHCCMPSACVGVTCPPPTCVMSLAGECTESSSLCDTSTGACIKNSKTVPPSCMMAGTTCVASTPSCTASATCAVTTTKLAPSCKQNGTNCIETTPTCGGTSCVAKAAVIPNSTCQALTGTCSTSTACKVDCDCNQGFACINGQCLSPFIPVYCCDKAGCPVGQPCTDKTGKTGVCGTTLNACQKQGGYCKAQFTPCQSGYVDDSASCGGALSLTCCVPGP